MEVEPGIFVTTTAADEWQVSDSVPGEVYVLCSGDGLSVGLWRSLPGVTPEQLQWTAPTREAKIVLAGTSRIEIKEGPTLELKAGDIASLPKGTSATWSFSSDYKEMWILEETAQPTRPAGGSGSTAGTAGSVTRDVDVRGFRG